MGAFRPHFYLRQSMVNCICGDWHCRYCNPTGIKPKVACTCGHPDCPECNPHVEKCTCARLDCPKCNIKYGLKIEPYKHPDTIRLDALQRLLEQGEYTGKCILRSSVNGRGFRLHETSQPHGVTCVRTAIDNFLKNEKKDT